MRANLASGPPRGALLPILCALLTLPSLASGGMLDTPLPTFSDAKAAVRVGLVPAVVKNNTLLLSLNNSIIGQLGVGDGRKNYVLTGGIWTSATGTDDAPIPNQTGYQTSDLRGSLKPFNATMETYTQGNSCFSCHSQPVSAPNSFGSYQLSHIYAQIDSLIPR